MLVPSRGWTVQLTDTLDTARFGLLGPFYRGQILQELLIGYRSNGVVQVELGAVLTWSGSASVESWQAGSPLVERSDMVGDGHPVIRLGMGSNNPKQMVLPIGRLITETPVYMVVRVVGDQAAVRVDTWWSCQCVESRELEVVDGAE